MATKRVFLGNIKGPKGDAYVLTDEDRAGIIEEIDNSIVPEVWRFGDWDGNYTDKIIYTGNLATETWRFTLQDGSIIEKGVSVR